MTLPKPTRGGQSLPAVPAVLTDMGSTPEGNLYFGLLLSANDGTQRHLRVLLSHEDSDMIHQALAEIRKATDTKTN